MATALMVEGSGFTHRQTMAGAVRFNSPELHEEAIRITQAGGHALAAEASHLEELIAHVLERRDAIAASADTLARIDVAAALAERAAEGGWCQSILCRRTRDCISRAGGIRSSKARWRNRATVSFRTTAIWPPTDGCGWSAAPIWAANRRSCGKMR